MANVPPEWETTDELGTMAHANGTVGTTPVDVPSVAGNIIEGIYLRNTNQETTKDLLISIDGGSNWLTIERLNDKFLSIRGYLTQIKIKGAVADVNYEGIIWFGEN